LPEGNIIKRNRVTILVVILTSLTRQIPQNPTLTRGEGVTLSYPTHKGKDYTSLLIKKKKEKGTSFPS